MPLDSQSNHPLAHIKIGAMNKTSNRSIPLTSTEIDVQINSGISIVKTTRVFTNKEKVSIEATLTFPIPVHATMMSLEAKIDERLLKGVAKRKAKARETYETALDAGKTAILHEEVLRGLHMLSVGHVAPDKEVKVICTWAMPLVRANFSGDALLRIPTTIGDIYGMPPMLDSVAPTHDSFVHKAHLKVTSDCSVSLAGGGLINQEANVALNSPIDLKIVGVTWGTVMNAMSKSGKAISLRVAPGRGSDEPIQSVVLVDRSSSMSQRVNADTEGSFVTKHQVLLNGLKQSTGRLKKEDQISLWQFDSTCEFVGKAKGAKAVGDLIPKLGGTRGSTELGSALQKILSNDESRDILIATDGKTYSMDVQELAQSGRRFHVVLIGDDSLDANVGFLAAMTGGELFPVSGQNSDDAILLAIEALRRPDVKAPQYVKGMPKRLETFIGGMVVNAEWNNKPIKRVDDDFSNAIVAIATSMALAGMEKEKASDLAEQEGIVCHLTSLVLVDEEATAQEGIPEQRKVHLSIPATHGYVGQSFDFSAMSCNAMASGASMGALRSMSASASKAILLGISSDESAGFWDRKPLKDMMLIPEKDTWPLVPIVKPPTDTHKLPDSVPMGGSYNTLRLFIGKLSWDQYINEWLKGDLSNLMPALQAVVQVLAQRPDVMKLSQDISKSSTLVVLAILALIDSSKNVGAQRFARSIFAKGDKAQVDALMKSLS